MKNVFGDKSTWEILIKSFPSKKVLSAQTDLFADRRARALDAYLQILWLLLQKAREEETESHGFNFDSIVEKFFEVPFNDSSIKDEINYKCTSTLRLRPLEKALKTPNVLIGMIEGLMDQLFNLKIKTLPPKFEEEFHDLQAQIRELQRKPENEDLRCINKFYDLKREIEIWRIKSGNSGEHFENSFSLEIKNEIKIKNKFLDTTKTFDTGSKQTNATHGLNLKTHLRGQEDILSDLADTLKQQKHLSQEIWSEIKDQHRILEGFSHRQEDTIEELRETDARVKKIIQ